MEEFLFFFDDSPLEPADDVHGSNYDHGDEQNNLYSFEVADQLFNAGRECEAEACKHANPNDTAYQSQERELKKAEVGQPAEYRAGGSKTVYVLHDEHRQHSELAYKLFDPRPRADKEVPGSRPAAKARADHVAERVAHETSRRTYDESFLESEEPGPGKHARKQKRKIALDHRPEEHRPQPVSLQQLVHSYSSSSWFAVSGLLFLVAKYPQLRPETKLRSNIGRRILAHFAKIDIRLTPLLFSVTKLDNVSAAPRVPSMTTSQETASPIYIGIDLGGAALKAALISHSGEIIHETRFETEQRNPDVLFDQVVQTALALRDDPNAGGRIAGIGVGIPGLVNRNTNRIEVMPNLPALSRIDITTELSRETGLPVILDNDANAAAYGELQVGAARGRREVFFVMLGQGIGAGLIINGQIYRGAAGFAGEFGHMTIDPEGIECACGNIGCLETIASGPNIVRRTRERLYRDRTSSLSRLAIPRDREFTAEDIAHAAREGDEMAQVMMERTGMFLGIALAAVINLLNVEMVVMGGGVMDAGDLILKPTIKETRRRAFPPSFNSCEMVIAELGAKAGMIGAALLARDQAS